MLDKARFMTEHPEVSPGTVVFSKDGEKLGTIVSLEHDCFSIEKGFFFPKEFTARYSDIVDIRDGTVVLSRENHDLQPWRSEGYEGWNEYDRLSEQRATNNQNQEDVRVQVAEEELEARKTMRQAGGVTLRKIVHTEMKTITVPVLKEEIRVERTPVSQGRSAMPGEAAFREETITVPRMEEEIEITKRPVVKEEIRVQKATHTEQESRSGEVRKEEVVVEDVETEKGRDIRRDKPFSRKAG